MMITLATETCKKHDSLFLDVYIKPTFVPVIRTLVIEKKVQYFALNCSVDKFRQFETIIANMSSRFFSDSLYYVSHVMFKFIKRKIRRIT